MKIVRRAAWLGMWVALSWSASSAAAQETTATAGPPLTPDEMEEFLVNGEILQSSELDQGLNGAWKLGSDHSDRFAAVVPIAGRGVHAVCRIRPTAIWIFHGADDATVPPESSESMNRNLENCDANVQFTLYPGVGHDAETPTFQNPAFWEWLLSQRRTVSTSSTR